MMRCGNRVWNRGLARVWMQLSLACLLLAVTVGAGEARDSGARFNDLGHRMMCTCGCNQILLECNHVGCTVSTQMIGELKAAINHGDGDDLVLQGFVQKYGPTVLAAPPKTGFDLLAWITPGILFLLATLATAWLVRRWQLHAAATPAGGSVAHMASDERDSLRERIRKETEL